MRRFSGPDLLVHRGSLQALALSSANTFSIGDLLDLQYGGELQTIQFMGRANAFRPYGSVDWHLGDYTVVEYRYATSEPTTASPARDSIPLPRDLSESGPRMTLLQRRAAARKCAPPRDFDLTATGRQSAFRSRISATGSRTRPCLVSAISAVDTGDVLPDVYSGTFSYNGGALDAQGVRFVFQRKLTPDMTGTLDYAYGGVLDLEQPGIEWDAIHGDLHQPGGTPRPLS